MRWKNNQKYAGLLLIAALLTVHGCASPKKMLSTDNGHTLLIPAGIDSATAMKAYTESKALFVAWPLQERAKQKADSAQVKVVKANKLWAALSAKNDSSQAAGADTLLAIQKYNEGGKNLMAAVRLQKSADANIEKIKSAVLANLESARAGFEESIMLNPFDRQTRLALAKVYQLLAERFLAPASLQKAIDVLENLVRIERDQDGLYARLAQCYFSKKDWPNALSNFHRAEVVLLQTAVFKVPETQPLDEAAIAVVTDSGRLFLYIDYQAEANIRLYRADSALYHLDRALPLARSMRERETIKSTKDWVDWDDGNIHASEMRDSLFALVEANKYQEAARDYRVLLPQLRTERAKREITWRLALLEFSFLEKQDDALRKMQQIVAFYANDSTGAVADTLHKEYFKTYGTMCYNSGLKSLQARKLQEALAYFIKSVDIPWDQRAKGYLEIAKLSVNSPEKAVSAAKRALDGRAQLSADEQLETLNILLNSLKRLQQFDLAKQYFEEYRQFQKQVEKNAANKN